MPTPLRTGPPWPARQFSDAPQACQRTAADQHDEHAQNRCSQRRHGQFDQVRLGHRYSRPQAYLEQQQQDDELVDRGRHLKFAAQCRKQYTPDQKGESRLLQLVEQARNNVDRYVHGGSPVFGDPGWITATQTHKKYIII
jgi:hypothetical protein